MPKTILVPTDYSIRSLHILKHALARDHTDSLHIVFFTGVRLHDSITELLFFSRRDIIANLTTNEFREACQIIRNKYSTRIASLRFEIFTGLTQAAFENFLQGNGITEVFIPEKRLHYSGRCFDATSYLQKCALPKILVSLPDTRDSSQPNHLNELFTSWK